jgi:hypothetical protein
MERLPLRAQDCPATSLRVTLSPAAHRLHHQAESQLIPTARA